MMKTDKQENDFQRFTNMNIIQELRHHEVVTSKTLVEKVEYSLRVIEKAFDDYWPNLAISFNGGKDSTVLLYLLLYVYLKHLPKLLSESSTPLSQQSNPTWLRAIYFMHQNCFDEVTEFVKETCTRLNLALMITTKPFKEGLFEVLESADPPIKGIFMGTRRTDPYSEKLECFAETDDGWPKFIRVNPLLDWTYCEIWQFIRALNIPYCCLYNEGYTSIGGKNNTRPNPALLISRLPLSTGSFNNSFGEVVEEAGGSDGRLCRDARYAPAYVLVEDDKERYGRN